MTTDLITRLEDALPQTQCRQCGFTGCTEYARAIAAGTPINRCPPGGAAGIRALAAVTGRPKPRLPSPGLTPRAASAAGAACAFARRTPSPARPNTFSRLLTPTAQDARFVFPPVPWTASRCRIPTTSGITTMPGVQGAVLTPRRRGLPLKMTPFTVARRQTPNPR